ncbi:MAG: hypothetical protein NVS4B9_30580 [Ktedonobacteraceae bacterium]
MNTIAAHATALLDMRSTDVAALNHLAEQMKIIIEQHSGNRLQTEIDLLGERPAGEQSQSEPLVKLAAEALKWLAIGPEYGTASTDANIPISLNIPAVCIGITHAKGAHTLEEFLYIPPIGKGLAQLSRLCIEACNLVAQQIQ